MWPFINMDQLRGKVITFIMKCGVKLYIHSGSTVEIVGLDQ